MSELERILKLAGSQAKVETPSPAPEATQREMKPVAQEAVGEFAEPIYDLIDMHFEGDCQPVFDDLVRYLSGDQIEDFVADFRRNHELPMGDDMDDDMDEAKQLNASDYECEDCGDEMHKPTTDCGHDSHDENGDNWVKREATEELPEAKAKPDFADIDGDGDEKETMKKAAKDKEVKETTEETTEELEEEVEELEEAEETEELEEVAVAEEDKEELEESPTMDTTQLVNMMKNAGLSEEKIKTKLDEWANSGDHVNGDPEVIGEPYENFAQSVNTSLKRYLDAEDMKVGLKEHTVEELKEAYKAKKEQ